MVLAKQYSRVNKGGWKKNWATIFWTVFLRWTKFLAEILPPHWNF